MQQMMALADSMHQMNALLASLTKDMLKVQKGNKSAAQRVRVGTVRLEKIARQYRADSVAFEKRDLKRKKNKRKKTR